MVRTLSRLKNCSGSAAVDGQGKQMSRISSIVTQPPMTSASCSVLAWLPPILYQDWSLWPLKYGRSDGRSLLRWVYRKHFSFCLGDSLSLRIVSLHRKSTTRSWAAPGVRNQSLLPMGTWSPTPTQAFRWLQPQLMSCLQPDQRSSLTTTLLGCFQIPEPCHIIHICYLQLPCFVLF